MWRSVVRRTRRTQPDPVLAPSPRDRERVDGIINRISEETLQVFDLLKDGMVKEASFKTVEEGITRHCILSTFEQVRVDRSEEHTSELQSLMRISYAVFCLKTKKQIH